MGQHTYFAFVLFIFFAVVAVFVWLALLCIYTVHEVSQAPSTMGYLTRAFTPPPPRPLCCLLLRGANPSCGVAVLGRGQATASGSS